MKIVYRSVLLAGALLLIFAAAPQGVLNSSLVAAQPDSCSQLWQEASLVMSQDCTDFNPDHTVCYAHAPLVTTPPYGTAFDQPGELINIGEELREVIGTSPSQETVRFGGFAYLKVIPATQVDGIVYGSSISMVSFGETRLASINSSNPGTSLDASAVCDATLRAGSTTFGGTYLRAIPDPNFQVECVTPGCDDKDNLLHFAQEGETLSVFGRNAAGDSLLVSDDHATGWIPSSTQFVQTFGCPNTLPLIADDVIPRMRTTQTELPIVTEFELQNDMTFDTDTCLDQNRPPGGLLIINPMDVTVAFTVNDIEISISSTVFLWTPDQSYTTNLLVLHGSATMTAGGSTLRLTAGESAYVFNPRTTENTPQRVAVSAPRVNWCQALTELARTVYQPEINGVAVGIPEERTDYCQYAPSDGYSIQSVPDSFVLE